MYISHIRADIDTVRAASKLTLEEAHVEYSIDPINYVTLSASISAMGPAFKLPFSFTLFEEVRVEPTPKLFALYFEQEPLPPSSTSTG